MKSAICKGILSLLLAFISLSCASTPKNEIKDTSNQPAETPSVQEELPPPPSASELFAQKLSDLTFTLISSPKETTKGKIFTSPYIVKVEDSAGKPVESFEISVRYPSARKTGTDEDSGSILFAETSITTDSEGKAEFLPPPPEFSFNSEISFFPKYPNDEGNPEESAKMAGIALERTITSPFKVQTNQKSAGGVIAVVDFNLNEKPVLSNPVSCQNILMSLMKQGFIKIGNAPQDVMNAVIQDDEKKIHARAKPIAPSFIIFGTVKIDSLEKSEAGFTYVLTGLVKSMDSKTGEIVFSTQKTVTVTDKNDWNALANARKTLADELTTEIKYGI